MDALQGSSWLYLYMPIAGLNIFWPGLVLIGFSVGTIGGFFGMGGAWMVTPGLASLGNEFLPQPFFHLPAKL